MLCLQSVKSRYERMMCVQITFYNDNDEVEGGIPAVALNDVVKMIEHTRLA